MFRQLGFRSAAGLVFLVVLTPASQAADSRWIRLRSAHFEMETSAGPRSARDTLREFEQVRGFFVQAFGGTPAKPLPVHLVAFGSEKEYLPYRPNEFAIAYYQETADRDYIVMSHSGADTFPIAVHEYMHLLVRHQGLKLPPWLNEGLAELYSTLRPMGDKILVGDLIAHRHRALLEDKWVPLATILSADQRSPYYNEKSKAGSLYNEGWGLTHMIYFQAAYRSQFGDFLRAISGGGDSAEALLKVYGKSVAQVEKDLKDYLRGSFFQGALIPAKLEKNTAEIPVEPLSDFDTGYVLAGLLESPSRLEAYRAALDRLVELDPQRPETYRGFGYLSFREGKRDQAIVQFGKAYERGDRDEKMLWDYGRLLEASHGEEAIRVLVQLLAQDTTRMEVRLELAEAQLRANQNQAALTTLNGTRTITTADAQRYFRIAVYAQLRNNDSKAAEATARHFLEVAKTDDNRVAATTLLEMASAAGARPATETAPILLADGGPPRVQRTEPADAPRGLIHRGQEPQARTSISGRFVELECKGTQARMILDTAEGRKFFLIEDPKTVVVTAGDNVTVDMSCGVQKNPGQVAVGYEPPSGNQTGVHGVVRTLAF